MKVTERKVVKILDANRTDDRYVRFIGQSSAFLLKGKSVGKASPRVKQKLDLHTLELFPLENSEG